MNSIENNKKPYLPQSYTDRAIHWIGSVASLVIHTLLFAGSFLLVFFKVPFDKILLVVTTIVSLEAIYLAIFIQMAVNRNTASLEEVEENIDEIQKDVDDIQEDVDEIEKDDDQQLVHGQRTQAVLSNIERQLQSLIAEIEQIKQQKK